MEEAPSRQRAGSKRTRGVSERLVARPDRIALWAVFLALFAALAAAASSANAGGGSGGIADASEPPPEGSAECARADFGDRALELGDCGPDVRILNWILKSKPFERGVGLGKRFDAPTDATVRAFQGQVGLASDGVVEDRTRRELKRA